ncbi:hypothetical protein [Gloeocapsa sp. PCC 73106]|uniref:hypothetical protein n=1 Tax=Gloeocapsa sp. PCC 73106 TaxID=102232 RepID=UPI0002ACD8D7|nr:hypothetical protein [Gloeocapsa sp. PCC 73106]ELR98922.1 hypothetical protein GLO73106DRAFT_00027620 [Gloeocapsa sp. PCC 73106]
MDSQKLQEPLNEIKETIWLLANDCQGETQSLLSVLRTLESLHREIREELFEPSLPNTRKALYNLLRDIEETGGWPYIERMKLQDYLNKLQKTL